jgi:uncharacterized membrane protein
MLSVIIGTLGIVSFYCFLKAVFGKKYAFFAAFLLAVNPSHIGYSNEIRAYILQMTLAPLAAYLFFLLLRKESVKIYVLYILAGAALVNTHYYGVLLVAFNAVFYIVFNRKRLFIKKTFCFIAANVVIALSLLPFFIITAFQKTVMDSDFNTWIPKPEGRYSIAFVLIVLVCVLFPLVKWKSRIVKSLLEQSAGFLDYVIYAVAFIFISAYLISLKRPILTWRYLSLLLPLLIAVLPLGVFNPIRYGTFNTIIRFVFAVTIMQFSIGLRIFGDGGTGEYKEAQEYISADAEAHLLKAAKLYPSWDWDWTWPYYGLAKIDAYSDQKDYGVVYINPVHTNESSRVSLLSEAGMDAENMLKIRIPGGQYIWKKYIRPKAGD